MPDILVRAAVDADMDAVRDIYAHEVLNGVASFEEAAPDVTEIRRRRADVLRLGLPYLVAEVGGAVAGYSYASTYRARSGYRFTVENSVYVAAGLHGSGVGRALLAELIRRCEAGPWRQMVAVIGDSANLASIRLHERHGFRAVGVLDQVGFKFGRWVDSVLMQRALAAGAGGTPASPAG